MSDFKKAKAIIQNKKNRIIHTLMLLNKIKAKKSMVTSKVRVVLIKNNKVAKKLMNAATLIQGKKITAIATTTDQTVYNL